MKKAIAVVTLLLASFNSWAQDGSISPYSNFGIGELRPNATIENRSMASLATFTDSIHLNLQNPSAYGKLKVTTYALGLSNRAFRFKTETETQKISNTNLEYVSLGFPVHPKAAVGFGLMPFSSVGYRLRSELTNEQNDTIRNTFTGEGGLSRVYLSAGVEVMPDLYVGASVRYNFGNLTYDRIQTVQDVQYGTLDARESRVSGFDFNYAVTYSPLVRDKYRVHSYLGIDTQINLVSENNERIGSFFVNTGQEIEFIDVDLESLGLDRTSLIIPTQLTLGLGLGEDKKWFAGVEYRSQDWSNFSNDFLRQDNVGYSKASSFRLGGYYIPNYDAINGIYNRVVYRGGLRFENTGLMVNGEELKEFGITFGLGIPIGGGSYTDLFSNLNIGLEFGSRGTTGSSLVKENYSGIAVGLSLNDRWFIKRRIN